MKSFSLLCSKQTQIDLRKKCVWSYNLPQSFSHPNCFVFIDDELKITKTNKNVAKKGEEIQNLDHIW